MIPTVDFAGFGLDVPDRTTADPEVIKKLSEEILEAFTTVGFVYITNTGITQDDIECVLNISEAFFTLPEEVKKNYERPVDAHTGYVCQGRETLNKDRPFDIREAYNITPDDEKPIFPDEVVPEFRQIMMNHFNRLKELTLRVLYIIAVGLKLEDPLFFEKNHKSMGIGKNITTLRSLYYPAISNPEETLKPGQIRCGEHSDYGSITLLWQDQCGGLEVMNRKGVYQPAIPVEGAFLANIADMLQRWTSDKLISAKHRVMIPDDPQGARVRQSIVYFVHPDCNTIIEPVDGSDKYPPITAGEYTDQKFAESY